MHLIQAHIPLSVIAKTLEKNLLPYIIANIPHTHTQHGYKTQHSTVTALHTLNNIVAKGFNQMAPHARTINVALDMTKAFDIINIHTFFRTLLQTRIPGTIMKFITNYIKGCKSLYHIYKSHILITSIQNWHSTRWRPFTNTIQHLHCRHTTSQEIHTTIPT